MRDKIIANPMVTKRLKSNLEYQAIKRIMYDQLKTCEEAKTIYLKLLSPKKPKFDIEA